VELLLLFSLGTLGAFVGGWIASRIYFSRRVKERDKRFLHDLEYIAASVSADVRTHSASLGVVEEDLRALVSSGGEPAMRCARRMLEANGILQSKLRQAEDRLRRQSDALEEQTRRARIDPLTQTYNRRALDEELRRRVEAASRGEGVSTLAMLDVDHFKRLNDEHGHLAGDAALKAIASCLHSTAPEAFVARYGGEEFALIYPGAALSEVRASLVLVRKAIGKLVIRHGDSVLSVTATIGAAACCKADHPHAWIELADSALCHGKRNGRNCCVVRRDDKFVPIDGKNELRPEADPAATDFITGLSSRKAIQADFERQIAFVKRKEGPASVLQIQLDGYDEFLNRYGFAAAEQALRDAASIVRESMRDSDHAGRVGRARFAVLLRDADQERAEIALARFREALVQHPSFPLSVSLALRQIAAEDDAESCLDALTASAPAVELRAR
jgi:diguanylate cyclase